MKWSWLLLFIVSAPPAEARPWMERLDHWIWGQGHDLSQAYDAYDANKFEDSNKAFSGYAARHPEAQEQIYNAGVAAFKAGKADDAMKHFERAAMGPDTNVKAKALANEAVIHIGKKELEPARDRLKEALAFDNENKAIQENLAWVEEQLKNKKPDGQKDKKDQDQNKQASNDQKKDENQQSKDEKSKGEESKEEKSKEGKAGDQRQAQDEKAKDEKAKEQESKEAEAGKEQDKDKQAQQKQAKAEGRDHAPDARDAKDKAPKSGEKGYDEAGKDTEKAQAILTPAELKNQEAERMLRTIDDKIGRYPLTETEATGERGKDGKNW